MLIGGVLSKKYRLDRCYTPQAISTLKGSTLRRLILLVVLHRILGGKWGVLLRVRDQPKEGQRKESAQSAHKHQPRHVAKLMRGDAHQLSQRRPQQFPRAPRSITNAHQRCVQRRLHSLCGFIETA